MTAQVSNNRSTVLSKWRSVFRRTLSNSHNDDTLPRIRSDYGEQRNIYFHRYILGTHRHVDQYNYDAPATRGSNAWSSGSSAIRFFLPPVARGDGAPLKKLTRSSPFGPRNQGNARTVNCINGACRESSCHVELCTLLSVALFRIFFS